VTEGPRRPASAGARRRAAALGGGGHSTRLRRYLPIMAVLGLALLVVVGLAAAPVSSYLRQREQTGAAEAELAEIRAEVDRLDARLQELRTDEAVERIARQHYDLVFPGEESYRILPAPEPEAPEADPGEGAVDDPAEGPGTGPVEPTEDGPAGVDEAP
jgi:cell division protein FtsB